MKSAAVKEVFICDPREDYRRLYALNIYAYTGCKITMRDSIKGMSEFLSLNTPNCIIINGLGFPTIDCALKIKEVLKSNFRDVNLILIGETKSKDSNIFQYDESITLRKLIRAVAHIYHVTAKQMASQIVGDYFPIPMDFVLPGWLATQNLYKKIDQAYEVLIKKGDVISADMIDILSEESIKNLYVLSSNRLDLVNSFTHSMVERLQDDSLTLEEKSVETEKGYRMVMEQVNRVGISETITDVAKYSMRSMQVICESIPKLDDLLNKLMNDTMSYRYRHSLLINFIGTHIIKQMKWGAPEHIEKFTFLSFFHDIALPNDDYARFESDDEVDRANINPKHKTLIKNHAMRAAKLVSQYPKVPFGIETIIKQHHGCKKGDSLSKLSMGVSPLAIIFIFSEEWANLVIESQETGKRISKAKVIEYLAKTYNIPNFKKIIPVLHSLEI